MKLPARVRISRLPGPPGEALWQQLRRLSEAHAPRLARLVELPSGDVACFVVIAGGRPVGYLLAERTAGTWSRTLVLESTWRGRGIEGALEEALGEE